MGSPMEEPMGEPMEEPMGEPMGGSSDKPFDDTPFDAGVESNEDEDPEKYIQQLSGKLGQSLRAHTDEMGSPDYDLEKFAINSVLSATNSGEMDNEDQADIIKKVKSSSTDGSNDDLGDIGGEEPVADDGNEDSGEELDLDSIDMEEGHNPNPQGQTVFQDMTLGVKDGGMEENKYLNLESTKKSNIFVGNNKLKGMIKKNLMTKLNESPEPITKPAEPIVKPSRRTNPFKPPRRVEENPQPKAVEKEPITYISNGGFEHINNEIELTFDVGGIRFVADFENTHEPLSTPMDYDEPWGYSYETDVLSNGKRYGVTAEFYGNPQTDLTFSNFEGDGNPVIDEI